MGPEMLREFQAISAAKPEEAAGIGDDANAPSALTKFLAQACNALVRCASTLQYEAATLPARQMQQTVLEINASATRAVASGWRFGD